MPDAPKPVTVGDLMVTERADLQANTWGYRRATLADLVSALRAEGVLVVEKVDDVLLDHVENVVRAWAPDLNSYAMEQFIKDILGALAEARP